MDTSIIEFYRTINNSNNLSKNEVATNSIQKHILKGFYGCGSYYRCQVNGTDRDLLIYGSSNSNTTNEKMKIITKPNETILLGDIVQWKGSTCLVTKRDIKDIAYTKAEMMLCNDILKFYDKTSILNTIISIPCIKNTASKSTINENKFMNIIEGVLVITVPLNIQTRTIYKGQRFIIGREVYKVSGFDETACDFTNSAGILVINMESTEEDTLRDDFVNGVAWNDGDIVNDFKINILNGSDISLNVNQEQNINIQVLNNKEVISPTPELIYMSSNELICTIDTTGKIKGIAEGNCVITVTLKTEPTIKSNINISVTNVVTDNLSIQFINPINQIKLGKIGNFDVQVLNNGIEVTKNVEFTIRNEDGSSNIYATIESINGTSCLLKATNNTSYRNKYFYLECSLIEDSSIFVEKMVRVASLV